MDYEKKYKEALSKAKDMLSYKEIKREDMEYLFPELEESEEEKIRKEIISFLKEGKPYYCPNSVRRQEWANWLEKQGKPVQNEIKEENIKEQLISYFRAESRDVPHRKEIHDKWISWIEKQGEKSIFWSERIIADVFEKVGLAKIVREQKNDELTSAVQMAMIELEKQGEKPQGQSALEAIKEKPVDNANKIQLKFKAGDYIKHNLLCNFIAKVISVNDDCYELESIETHKRIKYSNAEQNFHLWTIRDAKDGDILSDDGEPFIFKGLDPHHLNSPVAYCGIDHNNCFLVGSGSKGGTHWWCANKKVKPATKEQRDLLFTKMKEAGYEWIDYEKELVCAKN